jgi:hypothetical protein
VINSIHVILYPLLPEANRRIGATLAAAADEARRVRRAHPMQVPANRSPISPEPEAPAPIRYLVNDVNIGAARAEQCLWYDLLFA